MPVGKTAMLSIAAQKQNPEFMQSYVGTTTEPDIDVNVNQKPTARVLKKGMNPR